MKTKIGMIMALAMLLMTFSADNTQTRLEAFCNRWGFIFYHCDDEGRKDGWWYAIADVTPHPAYPLEGRGVSMVDLVVFASSRQRVRLQRSRVLDPAGRYTAPPRRIPRSRPFLNARLWAKV